MSSAIIGLIGGTGLGQALAGQVQGRRIEVDTPFGRPSAALIETTWHGLPVVFLPRHGEGHHLCPTAVPYRANIYALKTLGVTHIIASGATGSLREEFRPRDLVVPDQVIDRTTRRPSTFFDVPGVAAHVDFAEPFCPGLRRVLLDSAEVADATVHDGGTYVCMEGPAFSTVAESRMHRSWGGDLIGMTCMPEAKLAREAEICYALIALPTDYDSWRPHDPGVDRRTLLEEILRNVEDATRNSVTLIEAALNRLAAHANLSCSCHTALDLAVWTRRDRITPAVADQYGVLLRRLLGR